MAVSKTVKSAISPMYPPMVNDFTPEKQVRSISTRDIILFA